MLNLWPKLSIVQSLPAENALRQPYVIQAIVETEMQGESLLLRLLCNLLLC